MKIHSEIKPPLKVGKQLTVLKFCTNLIKGPFIYYVSWWRGVSDNGSYLCPHR